MLYQNLSERFRMLSILLVLVFIKGEMSRSWGGSIFVAEERSPCTLVCSGLDFDA